MASSSMGWTTEASASEGEQDIPVMEAVRTDEALPEVASGASPTIAKVSPMEFAGLSIAAVAEAAEMMSSLNNTLTIHKQSFFDIIISCFNKVPFLQEFYRWVQGL